VTPAAATVAADAAEIPAKSGVPTISVSAMAPLYQVPPVRVGQ
jgi:hypothetical protein